MTVAPLYNFEYHFYLYDRKSEIIGKYPMPTVEQRKSILNLYNSGITPDIIALEMDLSQDDIMNILKESAVNQDSENISKIKIRQATKYATNK